MAMTRQENCNSVFDFVLVLLNLQMTVFQHLFTSKCVCKSDNSTLSINLYYTLQIHSPPCKFLFHLSNLLLSLCNTADILQTLLMHIRLNLSKSFENVTNFYDIKDRIIFQNFNSHFNATESLFIDHENAIFVFTFWLIYYIIYVISVNIGMSWKPFYRERNYTFNIHCI